MGIAGHGGYSNVAFHTWANRNLGNGNDQVREWKRNDITLKNVSLVGIDHEGTDGWWASRWLERGNRNQWPDTLPLEAFVALLKSNTKLASKIKLEPVYQ